jgi:hypothetical protein
LDRKIELLKKGNNPKLVNSLLVKMAGFDQRSSEQKEGTRRGRLEGNARARRRRSGGTEGDRYISQVDASCLSLSDLLAKRSLLWRALLDFRWSRARR